MEKKVFSIIQIKKYLKKKGFLISKNVPIEKKNNFGSISKTFLSSLIIISIFSSTPVIINFTKERMTFSKVRENNSKNIEENSGSIF